MHMTSAGTSPASLRFARTLYGLLLGGAFLWCAAILLAPLCIGLEGGLDASGKALYTFFHPICHQREDHSLFLAGAKLAVCTRCFAVYAGFFCGLLAYPLLRPLRSLSMPHRALLAAAVLPMLLDVGLAVTGLHESSRGTRLVTGSVFGLIAPFFIMPLFLEGMLQILAPRLYATPPHHPQEGFTDATET